MLSILHLRVRNKEYLLPKYYDLESIWILFVFKLVQEEELRDAALLVLANKQDIPGAMSAAEVSEALGLSLLRGRQWTIHRCSAIKGEGLTEGLDWYVSPRDFIHQMDMAS
jgi:signal recognition particle receptor subunit beta